MEFGCQLDSNYSVENKAYWQISCRLHNKRSNSSFSIKDPSGETFSVVRMKSYQDKREYFEGLSNPVKATNDDTHELICFEEEKVFTAREVTVAIGWLKSGKAAGEYEIRPEMLKALNSEGILWLTRVCQVA